MQSSQSSLTKNVTSLEAGEHVTFAGFLGRTPVLALGDGAVVLAEIGDDKRLDVHPESSILCAVLSGTKLITGGDDGRVVATDANGVSVELAHIKGRWIDALAARDDGTICYASGKTVFARDAKGEVKTWDAPSSVRGLAFFPKGYRLAIAHYNGASLWFPNIAAAPEFLEWKGSHLDVTVSPDAKFIVTSMQENMLHGWRIADRKHMRMSGYPAKTRSVDWSHDGGWLATSGAEACIVWPFQTKDGPMGKAPRECGVRPAKVSRVACHPSALIIAIGYEDGWILLCRLTDGAEILVRHTEEGTKDAVTALAWSSNGKRLVFGLAKGDAGVLDLPA